MSDQPSARARILVVDDEPSIVDSVATVLRYEGFDVDEANAGRVALQKVQDGSYDLIVLAVAVAVVPLIWAISHHEEWQIANGYQTGTPEVVAASDVNLDDDLVWSTPYGLNDVDDWSANLLEVDAQLV